MARTEIRYAAKVDICVKGGNCMKSKREIEQFLTMLELQEIMIPFFCPFRNYSLENGFYLSEITSLKLKEKWSI